MEALPEWIQKKIKESETYKERIAGSGNDAGAVYTQAQFEEDLDDSDGELPF